MAATTLLAGCSVDPGARYQAQARSLGLTGLRLDAGGHMLIAHYGPAAPGVRDKPLHVYLAGDGTPWIDGRRPASDPTPRTPVALRLAAQDSAPRLVLNRPCYAHAATPAACRPALWTAARYSPEVVHALDRALDHATQQLDAASMVLIGYSGGGTLAWLLAQRRTDVRALVTIAANLHVARWTEHHGFLPLSGSLDPAEKPPPPPELPQWHLVGGRDRQVPAAITQAALDGGPGERLYPYPRFDHHCCWERIWPALLERLGAVMQRCPTARESCPAAINAPRHPPRQTAVRGGG